MGANVARADRVYPLVERQSPGVRLLTLLRRELRRSGGRIHLEGEVHAVVAANVQSPSEVARVSDAGTRKGPSEDEETGSAEQ
jgi:hypothetical protein